ncbi:hypothetical protein QL285_093455 [Trifolium repens]|nr:hypothetical protein QL285_093455 [Trifolium repens]
MGEEQRIPMGDYCKMTDNDHISLGFQPANPANFDIKGNVLTGLRENQFDGRANNDPWDHLSKFSETCQIQKVPENVTKDQKKPRLFAFSLTGPAKDWLQCLPRGSIATWKELEDKFLERFFTHTLFQKRKSEILSFKQHESETLCEAYERFKLLMRRCPNHNISAMEQMQLFTAGMKMQHRMILDASAGGSIKVKTYAETKDLVEQMCQNEYNMSHDRNEKTPGILKVDQEIAYKVEIELLKRQLAEKENAVKEDSVKQVEGVCDFCLEDHPNGHCLPGGSEEQAKYMGNGYNPGWSKHPNLRWDQTWNQAQTTPQPRKPSPLEELLNKFANMSKSNFENIQTTVANQGATIKSLETQIGQLSKLVSTHVSKDIAGNTVDNPKEECKMLKDHKSDHEQREEQVKDYEEWFKLFGMTLEEAYDEFMRELEEYRESLRRPRLPIKKTDPRSVTILCQIEGA